LFVFSLIAGGLIAWLSHNYREYQAEQRLIAEITKSVPQGGVVSLTTNGEYTSLAGSIFM